MKIKPIKTDEDHAAALVRIDALMSAVPGTDEGDELDILATLVEAYEAKAHPIDAPDPVDAIQLQMELKGFDQSDLAKLFGSRSRASEILHRQRPLTLAQIRKLHDEWGVPPAALLKETQLQKKDKTHA